MHVCHHGLGLPSALIAFCLPPLPPALWLFLATTLMITMAGVWQGVNKVGEKAGESKCALVFGQMNEPPGARARVALTGLTIAEYFRDIEGQDVLFFVDNIFRFTQVSFVHHYIVLGGVKAWRNA